MYIVCLGPRSHISATQNKIGCVYTRLSRATNGARCLYPGLSCQRNIKGEETSVRQHIRLQFKKKTGEILHLEHTFVRCWYLDTSDLESIETWCWRRIEKVSWTDRVKNEVVLLRLGGKEYPTYNTRIGHSLHRNCLLKLVFEGSTEGTGRRERRHKPLLDETRKWKDTGSWRGLGSAEAMVSL